MLINSTVTIVILTLAVIALPILILLQLALLLKFRRMRDGEIVLSTRMDLLLGQFDALQKNMVDKGQQSERIIRELSDNLQKSLTQSQQHLQNSQHQLQQLLTGALAENKLQLQKEFQLQRNSFEERQTEGLKLLQESIQKNMHDVRTQITTTLTSNSDMVGKRVDKLTEETRVRLGEISGQVEKRLSEGFEKTTATFADVVKRLALIDEAQKRITELSTNVVTLQEVLSDKRSRGAFGEVQLSALIRNVLPESQFAFQHTLSNAKRADCILFLPEPTGNMVIDSKFPLESYQTMTDLHLSAPERQKAERQFKTDIEKHINDIADKYIIPGETADGAMMFIPAEAIFAEIHAHFPGLVEKSQRRSVWMTSPTTMMAILTTIQAVLKDAQTRKEVHTIQKHLGDLAKDFGRFQIRMEKLATHIRQAHDDVDDVGKSARKISSKFQKIEKVELKDQTSAVLKTAHDEEQSPLVERCDYD